MLRSALLAVTVLLAATGCSSAAAVAGSDAGPSSEGSPGDMSDGGSPEANVADAPAIDATTDGTSGSATYRNSLSVCWRDAACPRALAISHGGDWTVSGNPYDSNAALEAAFANGADGVKIDVRVSIDDVPVISHSSPLQTFESLDCANQKIEEMTAAAVTACHRFPSTTQT